MCSPPPVVQNASAPPHRDRRAYLNGWPRTGFSTNSTPCLTRPPRPSSVSRHHRIPPCSRFSPHSAPPPTRPSWPPVATHRMHRFSTSPRAHLPNASARTARNSPSLSSCKSLETLRPEHHARHAGALDSNIMLAMPARPKLTAEAWSPPSRRALHRASPVSLRTPHPTTRTSSTLSRDIEVHHTHELRPHSEGSGHPSYLDCQDTRRLHPSVGPTGTA